MRSPLFALSLILATAAVALPPPVSGAPLEGPTTRTDQATTRPHSGTPRPASAYSDAAPRRSRPASPDRGSGPGSLTLVRVLGTVVAEDGADPVDGAGITAPAVPASTRTHGNGRFILLLPDTLVGRDVELVATAGGYGEARRTLTVAAPESEVRIEMARAPDPAERSDPVILSDPAVPGGTVTGSVGTPSATVLADVVVSVEGTGLHAVTDRQGRFRIGGVPRGMHTVTATVIGFGVGRTTVAVPSEGSITVDFTLEPRAVQLEGMVVTGTAIAAQRREVGNSIDLITSADIAASGASSVEAIVRGRSQTLRSDERSASSASSSGGRATAGAAGTREPGATGDSAIHVRGLTSVAGRTPPLIYVDGIRLGEGGSGWLDSLGPDAIDRIEVIKGPAARTLYGRNAAGGVIQIFTKAGVTPPASIRHPDPATPLHHPHGLDRESYEPILENPFLDPRPDPLSTFSIDVDRASYANTRRFVTSGSLPPADAVRIEELVNYFTYDDPAPAPGAPPFRITTEVAPAPWAREHHLVRIGLKAREIDLADAPPSNLVFLLDVSGSMRPADKLPLLREAMEMLVAELRPQDRVAIVVYAGAAGLVLESTPGDRGDRIRAALRDLRAGGSTAGGAGIELAYRIAAENHVDGGNNRVVLATDGDFNVGPSSDAAMVELIEEKREQGTFLSVLGFGTGNLQDAKMEKIADHGNGTFYYIDSRREAEKVLVREMGGTLFTVAKDVKIQVEFNPARVRSYRLIGYENRLLAAEDFADDTKDAGELGAGHGVTALYEVVPVGVDGPRPAAEALRYQEPAPEGPPPLRTDELLYVKLRWKEPTSLASERIDHPVYVEDARAEASEDLRFAAAVAAWGMLLRGSEHCGSFTLEEVATLARGSLGVDPHGDRAEFLGMVWQSLRLQDRVALRQELQREWSRRPR